MDRVDFPFLGNTIIMAVVILTHVFFAFFAVGGSVLAVFSEWWGGRKNDNDYHRLARGLSKFLSDMMKINGVLGVAIVVLTIGLWSKFGAFLYSTQFWPFLAEGAVFLLLMIFSVIYHNTWDTTSRAMHIFYGLLTGFFAIMAGVLINGIWAFMMVPGKWMETQSRWDAFFTPILTESTTHIIIPCFINAALILFVWSYWKSRKPSEDQAYYTKVNKFTGVIGASLLILQPISGIFFLLKVKSSTEELPVPNPWAQLSGGAAQPFLWMMIGLATVAVILTIIYWVRKHDKGRVFLLFASFCMFFAFFMGAYTREKARKPYLVWNVMSMDQTFTKTMKEKGVGDEPKSAVGAIIDGKQVFQGCKGCHVYKGEGGSIGPDLTNIAEKYAGNKTVLMDFIRTPPSPANMVMTPFSGSEAELEAVTDYLLQKGVGDEAKPAAGDAVDDVQKDVGDEAKTAAGDAVDDVQKDVGDEAKTAAGDAVDDVQKDVGDEAKPAAGDAVDDVQKDVGDEAKPAAGDVVEGEHVFQLTCKGCHAYKGEGGSMGPELTNMAQKYAGNKAELMDFIRTPPSPANKMMAPFSGSEAELEAVTDYLLQN